MEHGSPARSRDITGDYCVPHSANYGIERLNGTRVQKRAGFALCADYGKEVYQLASFGDLFRLLVGFKINSNHRN